MGLSLVEVAGANFRTDEESDTLNTAFMGRLGMRKRYLPARLAIARSLATSAPPEIVEDGLDPGKAIKGDRSSGQARRCQCGLR
jgi:DNA sulfur modification protein DndE